MCKIELSYILDTTIREFSNQNYGDDFYTLIFVYLHSYIIFVMFLLTE